MTPTTWLSIAAAKAAIVSEMGQFSTVAVGQFHIGANKCELIDRGSFETKAQARLSLFSYIEGWYNPRRRHSALGRISPANFERQHTDPTGPKTLKQAPVPA